MEKMTPKEFNFLRDLAIKLDRKIVVHNFEPDDIKFGNLIDGKNISCFDGAFRSLSFNYQIDESVFWKNKVDEKYFKRFDFNPNQLNQKTSETT